MDSDTLRRIASKVAVGRVNPFESAASSISMVQASIEGFARLYSLVNQGLLSEDKIALIGEEITSCSQNSSRTFAPIVQRIHQIEVSASMLGRSAR